MKYLISPLTKNMIAALQKGRTIELAETGKNVCGLDDYKGTLTGLYRRGFVITKMVLVDGKKMLGVFITDAGVSFLKMYEEDQKRLENIKLPAITVAPISFNLN